MIVKYYRNGKSHICDLSDINEYGESGYQWRNILAVVAGCGKNFPRVEHIDDAIMDVADWDDNRDELIEMLESARMESREYMVCLSESDIFSTEYDESWFYAEDEEDAYRRFILENRGRCDVEFIEGVGRLNAGKSSKIVRWWDENGDERFADIEAEDGQWRNILSMVARRGYLLPEVKENEYGKWVVWFEDDPDFEVLEAEDGEDAFKKCVEKGAFGNYKIEFVED